MIYTSYFAKLNKLPDYVIPISICGKSPSWYNGLEYKKLAPKYDFFMEWKKNKDNDYYIRHYNSEVLNKLQAEFVIADLKHLCDKSLWENVDICLICYEKPDEFCHRHLVANWLRLNGYECKEYEFRL